MSNLLILYLWRPEVQNGFHRVKIRMQQGLFSSGGLRGESIPLPFPAA